MIIEEFYVFAADSKGGRLFEINASEQAEVTPLARGNQDVYQHTVIPYLRSLDNDLKIHYERARPSVKFDIADAVVDIKTQNWRWGGLVFPGYSRSNIINAGTFSIQETYPDVMVVNNSYLHQTVYKNKDVLFDEACRANAANILPKSKIYKLTPGSDIIDGNPKEDFSDCKYVVIKPTDEYMGRGVIIVPQEQLTNTLHYLLHGIRDGRNEKRFNDNGIAEKFWEESKVNRFLIQEYIAGAPVSYKNNKWDATLRTVWSVAVGKDEKAGNRIVDVKAHGGYWKLPRKPITENDTPTQKDAISFSHAHGLMESFCRSALPASMFKLFFYEGAGDKIVLSPEELAPESDPFKDGLHSIFTHLDEMKRQPGYEQSLSKSMHEPSHMSLA